MSTQHESEIQHLKGSSKFPRPGRLGSLDSADAVALITRSQRERLLAINRHRLGREDLEDCYSQATLELLVRAARHKAFSSVAHIANALQQKFLSRIHDRCRAVNGRSPIEAAIVGALPLMGCEDKGIQIIDARADVEQIVFGRERLRVISGSLRGLTRDQRLVLASQLGLGPDREEFCQIHKWSSEKYRKVTQRARARLGFLVEDPAFASSFSFRQSPYKSMRAPKGAGHQSRLQMRRPCVTSTTARRISEQGPTYGYLSPRK